MTEEDFKELVSCADKEDILFEEKEDWRWGYHHNLVVRDSETGKMWSGAITVTTGDNGGWEVFVPPDEVEIIAYKSIPVFGPVAQKDK